MPPLDSTLIQRSLQNQISQQDWQTLIQWELADPRRADAFGINAQTVQAQLDRRLEVLRSFLQADLTLPLNQSLVELLPLLWGMWLPIAIQIAEAKSRQEHPLIQGILGGQGTGKTTLAKTLTVLLEHMGYATANLSIDDLYKTYDERCRLKESDPRLIWRGPPGTHDVELGLQLFEQIRQATLPEIAIPRFDKSAHQGEGDRTQPELVTSPDIVLFEGWFVGVRPIDPALFETAPPPIVTAEDRAFARDTNERLRAYLPLWEKLDRLILLYPTDYHLSQQWRTQAEHQMKATGKSGMSDATVHQFVEYFWKALHPQLFITPLLHHPEWVDLVIEIGANHRTIAIYRGRESSAS
jgi:D-glycerate 3-kinase